RAEGPLGNLSVKSDTQLRLGAILRKRRDLGCLDVHSCVHGKRKVRPPPRWVTQRSRLIRRRTMGQPAQQQEVPGIQSKMTPVPDCGEESYRGSGKLTDKIAVITGGDSGIGRAVAIAYAREGADVLISYLSEDSDAKDTAGYVEQAGRRAVLVKGDVADPQRCRDIIATAIEELGGVDILVSNAAYQMTHETLDEISDDEWDYTFDTNIGAMFRLCKAAIPHMKP